MTVLRAALIQTCTPTTQAAALAQIEPLIRQAAADGAQLIVTPEGSNLLQRDRAKMLAVLQPLETDPFVEGVRALAKAGAEMVAVPAAFTRPTGEAHWEVLLRARAIENGMFVLAAAQGGVHEDGRGTWGHSIAVDPWGHILAEARNDEPGVVMVDLDLNAVASTRQAIPSLQNDRPFAPPTFGSSGAGA